MKACVLAVGVGAIVLAGIGSLCSGNDGDAAPPVRSSIPYVATRSDAVRDMLWMAGVGREDLVHDLGSGDGRIASSRPIRIAANRFRSPTSMISEVVSTSPC